MRYPPRAQPRCTSAPAAKRPRPARRLVPMRFIYDTSDGAQNFFITRTPCRRRSSTRACRGKLPDEGVRAHHQPAHSIVCTNRHAATSSLVTSTRAKAFGLLHATGCPSSPTSTQRPTRGLALPHRQTSPAREVDRVAGLALNDTRWPHPDAHRERTNPVVAEDYFASGFGH